MGGMERRRTKQSIELKSLTSATKRDWNRGYQMCDFKLKMKTLHQTEIFGILELAIDSMNHFSRSVIHGKV